MLIISVLERVVVPEALVEELADLRFAFANLIYSYEEELQKNPESQEKFVKFLPRLFHRAIEDHISCHTSAGSRWSWRSLSSPTHSHPS